MSETVSAGSAPVLDADPYSVEVLLDPYPFHHELREAGPVVWLERYGVWATGRYDQVRQVITDWRTFRSGAGVGISDLRVAGSWRKPSLLLEADPPDHTVVRSIIERILTARAVRELREEFAVRAEALVERLVEAGSFDAAKDFAEVFPIEAFADAVGIPREGRENLLLYGNMVFDGFGPRNELFETAMERAEEVQAWILDACRREALAPDGFGAQIYEAADRGELTEEQAGMLVRSFLSAGFDTTVSALGNAVWLLATHPEQWELLHSEPSLARAAFVEAIRYESPVQQFFRTVACDTELAGVGIAEDDRIAVFFGSANRDPRRWEDPEKFDITRPNVATHLAFGGGIHRCVGRPVAHLEGELLLSALAREVESLELDGEPQRKLNNTIRSFESLPVRVRPAARQR